MVLVVSSEMCGFDSFFSEIYGFDSFCRDLWF